MAQVPYHSTQRVAISKASEYALRSLPTSKLTCSTNDFACLKKIIKRNKKLIQFDSKLLNILTPNIDIMYWNKNKECMSIDERRELQGKRLNSIVNYVYHNVPFYRQKMQEMDIYPDDIKTVDDIVKLPFTTKKDLRDNYPFGLQAAPASEIVRVHASTGTTGNPTIVGYTRKDITIWSECMARCLTAFGVTRNDVFSVAYGYGLFTGGLGAHYGVENLGATVIPASTGNTEKHIRLIHDLGITGIACTPSYALHLAETMER